MTKKFEDNDFLFGGNSVFLEELFEQYLKDPSSVDPSWRVYFNDHIEFSKIKSTARIINLEQPNLETKALAEKTDSQAYDPPLTSGSSLENSLKARSMVRAYRDHGHMLANLDPLNLETKKTREELHLTLEDFGFKEDDLSKQINISGWFGSIDSCSVGELYSALDKTYSGSIAVEFSHIENQDQLKWLYEQIEESNSSNTISTEQKISNLKDLVEVEGFEQYLHIKFPGAKRFSIEGGDSSVVALDAAIKFAANNGTKDVVLGMAHRGRLSTLAKVMKKPYRAIMSEFMGGSTFPSNLDISGDVKYHMGHSCDRTTKEGNKVHLSLTPNPSHLEAVNPVVAGKVRAKQDLSGRDRSKVLGLLIHGDAAFCGQGVVAESLAMSGLEAYDVGGIFHIVINNQIGFTTDYWGARSGRYCTEVAKMVGAPVLHVNGDDIESVLIATKIASEYRLKFAHDVVLDIVCYRKYGHNEGDEPMYTQSVMYNAIKQKQTPGQLYAEKLVEAGVIDNNTYQSLKEDFKLKLDKEHSMVEQYKPTVQWLEGNWEGLQRKSNETVSSGVKKTTLQALGKKLCDIPKDFKLNTKLVKLFATRSETLSSDKEIDWATGEQLAFASLVEEQIPIRISGQDAGRGTFSHRHSILHSQDSYETYIPLNNLSDKQAKFEVYNSNLSEYGVLGFEYGYSLVTPKNLVIWEAQFGDFSNGAQIMFDQFISSSETKWLRLSGLVMLLPHGYEGQGPEHSSARLERFLQMCAEENMIIAYPTTPASIFHLLRRQVLGNIRKPLVIMSPKSLLRHKLAVSKLKNLDEKTCFLPILDEIDNDIKADKVKRLILCSGKVYYDLLEKRRDQKLDEVAIIRLEQLYPLAKDEIVTLFKKYNKTSEIIWSQEEPKNMGAWQYIKPYLEEYMQESDSKASLKYCGRKAAASPAVGYLYVHNKEQEHLVDESLGLL